MAPQHAAAAAAGGVGGFKSVVDLTRTDTPAVSLQRSPAVTLRRPPAVTLRRPPAVTLRRAVEARDSD